MDIQPVIFDLLALSSNQCEYKVVVIKEHILLQKTTTCTIMKGLLLPYFLSLLFLGLSHGENHEYIRTRNNNSNTASDYHLFGADPTTKRCAARDPDERDHVAFMRAQAFAKFKAERVAFEDEPTTVITIPICFHNPQYLIPLLNRFGHRYITNEQFQAELDHLNRAFSAASCCDTQQSWCTGNCSVDPMIQFTMAKIDANGNVIGTTPSTSDPNACIKRPRGRYYMSMNIFFDTRKKRKLRVGDETILNIYYTRPKGLPFMNLLGYATFPWDYDDNPEQDGVVIEPKARRGGRLEVYNEGDTVVHEVGYVYIYYKVSWIFQNSPEKRYIRLTHTFYFWWWWWLFLFLFYFWWWLCLLVVVVDINNNNNSHWLGLYHTFQDACGGNGDQIDDTPAEGESYGGCTPSKNPDTCPTLPRIDPIHNFMDYSYDVCLYLFTAGQVTAMRNNVALYRTPSAQMARRSTVLSSGVSSDLYSLPRGMVQQFSLEVPVKASVSCTVSSSTTNNTTTTEGGNLDLFMNWDGDLVNFDCSAETAEAVEVCKLDPNLGTAYANVLAVTDVSDYSITCEVI